MAEAYRAGRWLVHTEDSVDSTQNRVKEGVSSLSDLSVIRALKQTAGRGRLGRSWVSPLGGLYFSFLMKPSPPVEFAPRVSLLAALALSRLMEDEGLSPRIKWPNDVVLDGRKVAGLLAESGTSQSSWFALGVGVNLGSAPSLPQRNLLPPGSWSSAASPEGILENFLQLIDLWWPDRNGDPLNGRIDAISKRLWKLGEEVTVTGAGESFTGRVEAIGKTGSLILWADSGERRFVAGELLTVQEESMRT